ncbi:MAG: aldo/keto reductase [Verrucomicrobia bacterium]|nr:aldo/keto reductase [Verrucomicrobiota bacterium]
MTTLGYGAMEVRGSRIWGGRPVSDKQADTILNAVLDAGINFIDTSNDYGRSEEFIGRYLSKRRGEFYIGTKCGCTVVHKDEYTDTTPHVWTKANLFRCLHESLGRLKTDYVDVMMLHNPSVEQCEQGNLVAVLQEMKQLGKVRWIGCSSALPDITNYIRLGVFDVFQIPYSGLERQHENVISQAALGGAGIIDRGGLARGEPGVGLGSTERWAKFEAANLDELRETGETRSGFLLRYLLSHPDIHTTIIGTLMPDHLRENIATAGKGPLSQEVYAEAKLRLNAAGETANL